MFIPRFRQVVIILAFLSNLLIAACKPVHDKFDQLYHQSSYRFVTITSTQIRASTRNISSEFTHLIVEKVPHDDLKQPQTGLRSNTGKPQIVTIRGKKTGTFVCFNKKKKLIVRQSSQPRSCKFEEIMTQTNYFEYRSVEYRKLYIGFNKNGKPLKNYTYDSYDNVEFFRFQTPSNNPQHRRKEHVGGHPTARPDGRFRHPKSSAHAHNHPKNVGQAISEVASLSLPKHPVREIENRLDAESDAANKKSNANAQPAAHKHRHHRSRKKKHN